MSAEGATPAAAPGPRWSLEGVSELPGVYLFRGAQEQVLYVGKARNLRARLTSYRRPGGDGRLGVWFLEREATRVETIVTRTEQEALLLEDQLVKQHQPPHNVRLKDDKSFLMIRVETDERFPRLKLVREHSPDTGRAAGRARFFGPFASSRAVRQVLSDLQRIVPLRDCSDVVLAHRTSPCMKHQIGLCSAPCVGLIGPADYAQQVQKAIAVLAGDTAQLEAELENRMLAASGELDFERAALWRDRIGALRSASQRQAVRLSDRVERDALGLARRAGRAVVHRLSFRGGALAESRSHVLVSELPDDELLHAVLQELYGRGKRQAPREILVPCAVAEQELLATVLGAGARLLVPQAGERARMLEMAGENARAALQQAGTEAEEGQRAVEQLAQLLGQPDFGADNAAPVIDCFDISNFQGAHMVASRVRFRGALADRAGYRHFRLKHVSGQDDFAALHEVVGRSLQRGLREADLPDLIVIDGGAQQLAKALEARDELGAWEVPMIALAKARSERLRDGKRLARSEERVYLSPAAEPLELPRHGALRHLLERLRDEAHRFAITFHRKSRGRIESRLDAIPGVGPARRKALLRRFGSVLGVRQATLEELASVERIGAELARVIHSSLRQDPA